MNGRLIISLFLRLLLWFYLPFLFLLCGLMAWLAYLLLHSLITMSCAITVVAPLVVFIVATLFQFLWAMQGLLAKHPDILPGELVLPATLLAPLRQWIGDIARRQKLAMPDEIRFVSEGVAYVYENSRRSRILALGGLAIAVFSQEALAGVIAHELAHFTAGDTALTRKAVRRLLVMNLLEHGFRTRPGTQYNPLVWLVHLYHWVFKLVWAVNKRWQEFAADRYLVEQAGKETAAMALLYLTVSDRLPWLRIDSIAKSHVAAKEPMQQIFAEHWRRAQTIPPYEWDDACSKELKKKTGRFDSHPCLRDRLKAMGVAPKQARKLIRPNTGTPARELFPCWPTIETLLTEELLAVYRDMQEAKREIAQILLRKPI